jgi:cytochrome c551/c552
MKKLAPFLVAIWLFGLVACGSESVPAEDKGQTAGPGDVEAGRNLYNQNLIGTQAGCMTCHSLEPGVTMVGPSLAAIGAEAGTRVAGMSAEAYLRQSILEPDAHLAEGFAAGIMPAALADELSAQQVNDLVAFLEGLN